MATSHTPIDGLQKQHTQVAGPPEMTTDSEVATINQRESERPFQAERYGLPFHAC